MPDLLDQDSDPTAEQSGLLPLLRQRILRDGPITVADYMALALNHPQYGYYQHAEPFGRQGDFITAPEICQCFGELIGLWAIQYWRDCGRPAPFNLVEVGPGRGTLMADILRTARLDAAFSDSVQVHLVEASRRLRPLQADRLTHLSRDITWHEDMSDLPGGFTLIVANEFFDALPVRQFMRQADGWHERRITWDDSTGKLAFCLTPPPVGLEAMLPLKRPAAMTGSIAEICPAGLADIQIISRHIAQHGGALLAIDYGYIAQQFPTDQPWGETLQAVRQHGVWPVLDTPGAADLTAHVDFTMLAQAGTETGLRASPVVPQGLFLESLGIRQRLEQLLRKASEAQARQLTSGVNRLVAADAMGVLFKVLGLAHPSQPPMPGLEPVAGAADSPP